MIMKTYGKLYLFMILAIVIASSSSVLLSGDIKKASVSTWQEATTGNVLVPIPVQTSGASPFIDANDTVEIESRENSMVFYSRNGERIYHPATNTWTVKISPNKYQDKAEKAENHQPIKLLPEQQASLDWYGVYTGLTSDIQIIGNMNYFRFSHYCLCGSGQNDLVDAMGRKIWQIPPRDTYYLHINPPFAWMGDEQGIVRMDFKTNRLTCFVLLPTFKRNIKWCDYQGKRYITSREKFIQVLDLQSGNISILNPPVEVRNKLKMDTFYQDTNYEPSTIFSNPVIRNGYLYTSIFGTNILLKYHIASGKWWFNILSKNSHVTHLIEIKDMLWLISALIEACDDGETIYGNIAAVDKNETIHYFPQFDGKTELEYEGGITVKYGVDPIRAYFSDADNIYFLSTYYNYYDLHDTQDTQYSRVATIIKLSGPNWKTVTKNPLCNSNRYPGSDLELYEIRKTNLNLFKQFIYFERGFDSQYYESKDFESQVQPWKVRYAMVEIPYGKARPVDYTKENNPSLNQEEEPGD